MDGTVMHEALKVLKLLGIHPAAIYKPVAFIHFLITFSGLLATLFAVVLNYHDNEALGTASEMLAGSIQVVLKSATILVHRKELLNVIDIINTNFWNHNNFGDLLGKDILSIHAFLLKMFKMCRYLLILSGIVYYLRPVFQNSRIYPITWYEVCDIQSIACYGFTYVWQGIAISNVVVVFFGFDPLMYGIISHAYCELMLIKHGFANLIIDDTGDDDDEEQVLVQFAEVVKHHDVVLRCIGTLERIYSPFFFVEFTCMFAGICGEMILMISEGFPPTLYRVFQSVTLVSFLYTALFISCFAGQKIAEQSDSVAYAVYECGWFKNKHPKLRKAMITVMQRAQKSTSLSIWFIIKLDMIAFTEVLKKSMTFFTFIKTMYELRNK